MAAVYRGMPDQDYRDIDAVSQSGLKLVMRSPRHYWHEYLRPGAQRTPPTAAMQFGTALHMSILEPHRVEHEIAVMPDDAPDKRSKAGREWHDEFARLYSGRIILSAADRRRLDDCCESVLELSEVKELLDSGEPELSLHWKDPGLLVEQKARLDLVHREFKFVTDIKTTDDASPDAFARSIWNYRYDFQAAAYLEAVFNCTDIMPRAYFVIAVETTPPHGAKVYMIDEASIARGRRDYERALATYAMCRHNGLHKNVWPAYESGISPISLPGWALKVPAR